MKYTHNPWKRCPFIKHLRVGKISQLNQSMSYRVTLYINQYGVVDSAELVPLGEYPASFVSAVKRIIHSWRFNVQQEMSYQFRFRFDPWFTKQDNDKVTDRYGLMIHGDSHELYSSCLTEWENDAGHKLILAANRNTEFSANVNLGSICHRNRNKMKCSVLSGVYYIRETIWAVLDICTC